MPTTGSKELVDRPASYAKLLRDRREDSIAVDYEILIWLVSAATE